MRYLVTDYTGYWLKWASFLDDEDRIEQITELFWRRGWHSVVDRKFETRAAAAAARRDAVDAMVYETCPPPLVVSDTAVRQLTPRLEELIACREVAKESKETINMLFEALMKARDLMLKYNVRGDATYNQIDSALARVVAAAPKASLPDPICTCGHPRSDHMTYDCGACRRTPCGMRCTCTGFTAQHIEYVQQ